MPDQSINLQIDGKSVTAPAGTSVLHAARTIDVTVPTMCFLAGHKAYSSCMVCVVEDQEQDKLIPACAAPIREGMVIATTSERVLNARRAAIELLLSEHLGDCEAPCRRGCPAFMDIPRMLRQITAGDDEGALRTIKADIPFAAVLGRICPAPCERVCRRAKYDDEAVAICLAKRFAADQDLASAQPWQPELPPLSGKHVAVIGAGPCGLTAAYYLRQYGHNCTVYDEHEQPGGSLRYALPTDRLPIQVLEQEIETLHLADIEHQLGRKVDTKADFETLCKAHDAVILAVGDARKAHREWGVSVDDTGFVVDKATHQTEVPKIFAGGNATRPGHMAVRSVAAGKTMALSVDQFLRDQPVHGRTKAFDSHLPRPTIPELRILAADAAPDHRVAPDNDGFTPEEAKLEAQRCMHCDCRAAAHCGLRDQATALEAAGGRFRGRNRKPIRIQRDHADIIYEPGKCIKCSICVRLTEAAREPLGLTFIGRGFDVEVATPFDAKLQEALTDTATACVENCPTGALAWRDASKSEQPAAGNWGQTY